MQLCSWEELSQEDRAALLDDTGVMRHSKQDPEVRSAKRYLQQTRRNNAMTRQRTLDRLRTYLYEQRNIKI